MSRLCRVGYALNPKKLRKSGVASAADNVHENSGKRWKGGGLADILSDQVQDGVSFDAYDFDIPVEDEPHFDVIIHKITEDIRSVDDDSRAKISHLERYLSLHPKTKIVDPLAAVENVITRSRVCHILDSIINTYNPSVNCPFSQPKYLVVDNTDTALEAVKLSNISFPVICKPIEACGTPNSHSMVIALSPSGLSLMKGPCIIQQYRDHSAAFFKVYVIDDEVMVYRRPSLPDLSVVTSLGIEYDSTSVNCDDAAKRVSRRVKSIVFDSRFAYPTIEDFLVPPEKSQCDRLAAARTNQEALPSHNLGSDSSGDNHHTARPTGGFAVTVDWPPRACVDSQGECDCDLDDDHDSLLRHCKRKRKPSAADLSGDNDEESNLASALKDGFGLSLFGFDVIVPNKSNLQRRDEYVVIDVNFFPSYKEVGDFPSRLRSFLRKRGGLSQL